MISILDLPSPWEVWEGDSYWGVLYYHYPDAIHALEQCRQADGFCSYQNDLPDTILDMERQKYIAPFFSFEGFEGEILIFFLRAIADDSEFDHEYQRIIRRIEDVKKESLQRIDC